MIADDTVLLETVSSMVDGYGLAVHVSSVCLEFVNSVLGAGGFTGLASELVLVLMSMLVKVSVLIYDKLVSEGSKVIAGVVSGVVLQGRLVRGRW